MVILSTFYEIQIIAMLSHDIRALLVCDVQN